MGLTGRVLLYCKATSLLLLPFVCVCGWVGVSVCVWMVLVWVRERVGRGGGGEEEGRRKEEASKGRRRRRRREVAAVLHVLMMAICLCVCVCVCVVCVFECDS